MGTESANNTTPSNTDLLKNLALQLSCPEGDKGILLGEEMNQSNATMIDAAIQSLMIQEDEYVLELGHGNAGHLERMFAENPSMCYRGLEVSPLMKSEAEALNEHLINNKDIQFKLFNGIDIHYNENIFDKILSVNTIYFGKIP